MRSTTLRLDNQKSEFQIPGSEFQPARYHIAVAWGALLVALLFWQTWLRASRPAGIDLTSYLMSARALIHGASPYLQPTPFPYMYPPTLAFLLIPVAAAAPFPSLVLLFCVSAGAASWAIWRVVSSARPDVRERPHDLVVFLVMFCTFFVPVIQSNLRNGQVNFLVLALCVAAGLSRAGRAAQMGRVDQ